MGFGHRHEDHFDGVMRLAFCLDGDGYRRHGAATVTQDAGGVHCTVVAGDPVGGGPSGGPGAFPRPRRRRVRRDRAARPGNRPAAGGRPRAPTPAVLLALRGGGVGGAVRPPVGPPDGRGATPPGRGVRRPPSNWPEAPTPAFPTPSQLLRVQSFPGLNDVKITRLHGIARAALEGWLDADALQGPRARGGHRQTPVPGRDRALLRRAGRGPGHRLRRCLGRWMSPSCWPPSATSTSSDIRPPPPS